MDKRARYTAKLFIHAVLPLFRVVAEDTELAAKWQNKNGIVQFEVITEEGPWGIHFVVENGQFKPQIGTVDPTEAAVALSFKSVAHFNAFFRSETKKLPKIKGFSKLGLLIVTMRTLLKMSALLAVTAPPKKQSEQAIVTKMMFYLLTAGISQLNKLGHPDVKKWTESSPNRVYALTVDDWPEVAAYVHIKAGKSRSARGRYTRSKPFFSMRFADLDSALAILLETGDLLALTAEKKLIMEGAPEYGAKFGDFMMLVGEYIK